MKLTIKKFMILAQISFFGLIFLSLTFPKFFFTKQEGNVSKLYFGCYYNETSKISIFISAKTSKIKIYNESHSANMKQGDDKGGVYFLVHPSYSFKEEKNPKNISLFVEQFPTTFLRVHNGNIRTIASLTSNLERQILFHKTDGRKCA